MLEKGDWQVMFIPAKKHRLAVPKPREAVVAATDQSRYKTQSANPPALESNGQRQINMPSPLVQALGTALAAIPIYQSAHADAPPEFSEMGVR